MEDLAPKEENEKAMIRGIFMGSGSINNPEKEYHLEMEIGNYKNLEKMMEILKKLGIRVKTLQQSI